MFPYWLLFGLFALGGLFSMVDPRRDKPLGLLAFAWVVLVLMIGLRWHVGADWPAYQLSWKEAGSRSIGAFLAHYERDALFYSLMWGFRAASLPYWSFNLLMAAIFATGLVDFARRQANPWLGIAVAVPYLVIVVAMSGVRQATAIGFVFLALVALQRREAIRFLIYMALAAAFHASAILVLPLAGLSFARTRLQASLLILILLVGAYYMLSLTFSGYSERYLSASVIRSSGTLVRIGMNVIPALIFLGFRKRFPIDDHEALLWRNMSIASLASLALLYFVASTTAVDRLVLYFFPLQIFVFGWVPWLVKKPAERFILVMLLLIYLALQLFIFLQFGVNSRGYLPYRTVLGDWPI
jgi:EpsG-like putative glucosyltransferase